MALHNAVTAMQLLRQVRRRQHMPDGMTLPTAMLMAAQGANDAAAPPRKRSARPPLDASVYQKKPGAPRIASPKPSRLRSPPGRIDQPTPVP